MAAACTHVTSSPPPTPILSNVSTTAMKTSQHSPYFNLYHHQNNRTHNNIIRIIKNLCYSWWFFIIILLYFVISTTESASTLSCSSRQLKTLQFEDAGAKAYISQVVFKGLVKTRTPIDQQGFYEASFLIQEPIKGFAQPPKKRRRKIKFAAAMSVGGCKQGVITANLDTNVTYLVFADRAGDHQLRALTPPMLATRRHEDAVERALCSDCVRPPSVSGLKDVTLHPKERLRLLCRYDGNPPPLIEWYRRGRRVDKKRARITTRKRRSVLAIPRVSRNDTGKYECRAVSVTGERASVAVNVSVTSEPNVTTVWPWLDAPCPISSYCLNGGKCLYYEAVGELVCECAEGYKGQRCENKDIYNSRGKKRRTSCCGQRAGGGRVTMLRRPCDGMACSSRIQQRRRRLRGTGDTAWRTVDRQFSWSLSRRLADLRAGSPTHHWVS